MVKETNGEQVLAGEASSSRRKRQRLVEEESEDDGEGTESGDRDIAGDGVITEARKGLLDLDILDCPVCFHALTIPIFQCDNGHIACSSCCTKLRNQCPSCTLPIGNIRNRGMERVLEAVTLPCPNGKHGCTKKFSYGKELAHEKECSFALCYCPAPQCSYTGKYKDLYRHYDANHGKEHFRCGHTSDAWVHSNEMITVLQEYRDGPLVVVQCFEKIQGFEESQGVYVTVNCIAPPSAPGVGEFSYKLTSSNHGDGKSDEMRKMKRIQKVSFQPPEKDFMLIPRYFLLQHPYALKMNICIRRLEEEEEVEKKDNEAEEEHDENETCDKVRRSTRERKANSKYQDKVK
ncbi:hypothetical protein EUTSA_v10018806mg [Eutrema salsugineum]|uniref:RING-type E3 ubiquitin transferase n=1 Tax=Eutrema salsugineum TaxID=72664 RepID=V4KEM5_EUTSA|nr:E3 ubiquitin-protein ligase SINA-like 2 [Eutrema salsugineum]ESQ28277.1 hypothetical protein EUTSA_v10018806mg [Eutrema salsugineum]